MLYINTVAHISYDYIYMYRILNKYVTHTQRDNMASFWLSAFQEEAFHFEALDAAQLPVTDWAERFDVVMDKAMLDAILSGRWKQYWMLGWLDG
jgi:hypothetical protein